MKLTCESAYGLLMDFLDATLPADAAASMRKHMADCPACTRMVQTYHQTKALCHDVLHKELPSGAGDKLMAALRDKLVPRG